MVAKYGVLHVASPLRLSRTNGGNWNPTSSERKKSRGYARLPPQLALYGPWSVHLSPLASFGQAVDPSSLASFGQAVDLFRLASFGQAVDLSRLGSFGQAVYQSRLGSFGQAVDLVLLASFGQAVDLSSLASFGQAVDPPPFGFVRPSYRPAPLASFGRRVAAFSAWAEEMYRASSCPGQRAPGLDPGVCARRAGTHGPQTVGFVLPRHRWCPLGSFRQDSGRPRWLRFCQDTGRFLVGSFCQDIGRFPLDLLCQHTERYRWVRFAENSGRSRLGSFGQAVDLSPLASFGPKCQHVARRVGASGTRTGSCAKRAESATFLSWVRFADFAKRFAADGARPRQLCIWLCSGQNAEALPGASAAFPGEAQHAASRDALRPVIVADSELDTVPDKRCTTRAAVKLAQTAYTCLRALALHRIRDTNRLMREALQSLNFLCWVRFADFAKRFAADDALPCQLCVWLCSGQNVKRARRVSGVSRAKRSTRLRVMRCDPGSLRISELDTVPDQRVIAPMSVRCSIHSFR